MKLHVSGVGLLGPGLAGWAAGREILAGRMEYRPGEVALPASALLPPAERRRMTDTVKLAIAVASEAIAHAGLAADLTPSVFASSGGDGATITAILGILASAEREVSPTRFHNSVHNAPSGYWSIATHAEEPSTSVCAYDWSFAAGLLEAAAQATMENRPVLLVAYDLCYPEPLHAERPIAGVFGMALALSPRRSHSDVATLSLVLTRDGAPETGVKDPLLEAIRAANPAGRSLPLLAALARGGMETVSIPHVAGSAIVVAVTPPELHA